MELALINKQLKADLVAELQRDINSLIDHLLSSSVNASESGLPRTIQKWMRNRKEELEEIKVEALNLSLELIQNGFVTKISRKTVATACVIHCLEKRVNTWLTYEQLIEFITLNAGFNKNGKCVGKVLKIIDRKSRKINGGLYGSR